jgi:hypothetical protein
MELLVKLVFVASLAWAFWLALQPRSLFVVRLADGVVTATKGVVTGAFLEQVQEVCGRHAVQRCTVRGVVRGGRISLQFSSGLPLAGQQQLRNWWAISGWSARPSRARRQV